MTTATPHFHILDTGEGDWGAHPDRATAATAVLKTLTEINGFSDIPMTKDDLTIVGSEDWCEQDGDPCYYDRNIAHIAAMRRPALWTHDFPTPASAVYRIDGKRVARWKMACSMSIDRAMEIWPFTGHPESLPIWRYDNIMADPELCPCNTRQHRKKGCIISPSGDKCSVCGALYQDYGNGSHHCLGCQDWLDRREAHLADWAAERVSTTSLTAQLPLL